MWAVFNRAPPLELPPKTEFGIPGMFDYWVFKGFCGGFAAAARIEGGRDGRAGRTEVGKVGVN